jgi:hypothetical protein
MFAAIDIALLMSETNGGPDGDECPRCGESMCAPMLPHAPGCEHDQALAERGFDTRASRDAARERIEAAHAGTEPPPR